MFIYPLLGHTIFADQSALADLFLGTSIHETAQVAGAGMMYEAQYNAPVALDIATVTKLVRNLCMIAVIPFVGILYGPSHSATMQGSKPKWWTMVPWFIVAFAMMSALRTVGDLGDRPFGFLAPSNWDAAVELIRALAERCLLIAMAGVGLTSMFAGIREIGLRAFGLGLFAAALIGGVSLGLISAIAPSLISAVGL